MNTPDRRYFVYNDLEIWKRAVDGKEHLKKYLVLTGILIVFEVQLIQRIYSQMT